MSGQPQDRAQGSTGTQPPEVAQPLVPKGPPKPRFALAVGVVGHRPNRLPSEHTEKDKLDTVVRHVGEVLDAIIAAANQAHADHKTLFNEETPLLSVVSSLAEGADRIVANLAISRKFKLDAPLPFTKDEYEKDFRPRQPKPGETIDPAAEKERSGKLIEELRFLTSPQNARAVLELPGTRKSVDDPDDPDAKRAYEAAGLTVLSQADILLAVWDGGPSEGRGGTSDMVAEAARAGMPIILVDAKGERPPEVRWRNLVPVPAPIVGIEDLPKVSTDKGLHRVIDELVRLPAAAEQRQAFAKWLKERPRRFNHSVGYPLLMSLLRVRRVRREDINPPPPEMLAKQYLEPVVPLSSAGADVSAVSRLAQPYGWADAVGLWCGQTFRSAFVMNFGFAALAVFVASLGLFFEHLKPPRSIHVLDWFGWPNGLISAEIVLIGCVMVNTWIGRRQRWHNRWVEARELAERFRVILPLWALGLRPASFPGEEATWMGWYVRAFVREHGLRRGNLTNELPAARSVLMNALSEQCEYNAVNAERMHKMERRLEWVGSTFFVLTLLVAIDHFFGGPAMHCLLSSFHLGHEVEHKIAIWLSAALPALATATYGIRVIGDFEGIRRRGERTHGALDLLIRTIKQDPPDFSLLRARARSAADAMLGDVSSWRLSAESRGLAIPG